jgi:hypothetical protein
LQILSTLQKSTYYLLVCYYIGALLEREATMQTVEERDLREGQSEREKSLEETAFTIPRGFRLIALSVIGAVIVICAALLILDSMDSDEDKDPSKKDLIGFLFVLTVAGAICSLEWEKLPFRISKIGPIELSDVVSGQAHEHAVAFDELRKRIDKLEEDQRKLASEKPQLATPSATKPNEADLEALVSRFLSKYNDWSFSPLRIAKWGSLQAGFEDLSRYQPDEIRRVLQAMVAEGKLDTRVSQKGHTLYRLRAKLGSL